MSTSTNREEQFQLTPAVIEGYRSVLQELPFDELKEILRIQEGKDPGDPPTQKVGRVSRSDTKELIDLIIEHTVKNHHPVTEERYQFVLCLYRIRTQYPVS